MSNMNPPPALKPLVRILKTAQQIEKVEPLVAYCCRHYAVELGMELRAGNNDPAIMKYLSELLDVIESTKALADSISADKEGYLRDFSDRVFGVAQTEYQSGAATKNTAKSFLHASVFYEALKQFAPLTDETLGKIRYSKFKATEIVTAISEGRQPGPTGLSEKQLDEEMNGVVPGVDQGGQPDVPDVPSFGQLSYAAPPSNYSAQPRGQSPQTNVGAGNLHDSGGDLDLPDVPVFSPSQLATQRPASRPSPSANAPRADNGFPQNGYNFQQPPAQSPQPYSPQPSLQQQPQAPVQQMGGPHPPHETAQPKGNSMAFNQFLSSRVQYKPTGNANIDVILEATKFSKNAISALQFDDPETAVKNLRAALKALTGQDH